MEQTINYRGYTIEIKSDNDPQNPRTDWDPAAHMVCWHRRYNLGDMEKVGRRGRGSNQGDNYQPVSKRYDEPIDLLYELAGLDRESCKDEEGNDWAVEELYRSIEERGTLLNTLYLYDHSGITISMGKFSCPWDSGPVGYIYMEKDDICNVYGDDSPESYEKAKQLMAGEVETYDDYLTGQVYGYVVEDAPGMGDSCWGFYGDEGVKDAISEAKAHIDGYIKERINNHLQKVKAWIRNKVPVIYRTPLQLA